MGVQYGGTNVVQRLPRLAGAGQILSQNASDEGISRRAQPVRVPSQNSALT